MIRLHTTRGGKTALKAGDTLIWFRESGELQVFRGAVSVKNGVASAEPLPCSDSDHPKVQRDFYTLLVGDSESFIETIRAFIQSVVTKAGLGTRWLPDEPTHLTCVLTKDTPG